MLVLSPDVHPTLLTESQVHPNDLAPLRCREPCLAEDERVQLAPFAKGPAFDVRESAELRSFTGTWIVLTAATGRRYCKYRCNGTMWEVYSSCFASQDFGLRRCPSGSLA